MSTDLILKSIINYASLDRLNVRDSDESASLIQTRGGDFEEFVKELFLDNNKISKQERLKEYQRIFSFQGATNNPPDLMFYNSYAIKINKKRTTRSIIPLNSSHPRDAISANDSLLKSDTREIEGGNWIKPLFYYIGEVENQYCKSMFIIDGACYTANEEYYQRLIKQIKSGVSEIPDVKMIKTKELGKVKEIDPLKVTDLRVRGMWNILHPLSLMKRFTDIDVSEYNILVVMKKDKFDLATPEMLSKLKNSDKLVVEECKWPNPNNLSDLFDVVIIKG